MSPPEHSNSTISLEKCNTAEAHDKVFKIPSVNIFKDLNEDMNKILHEVRENTNSGAE